MLVLVISLFSIPVVQAQTVNDQLYVDKSVSFWMATTPFNNPDKWVATEEYGIRRTSDNQLIYCIQAHVEVYDGSLITGYESESEKLGLTGLTREELRQIELISYYGYGYTGHTDTSWYAATQFLIWQVTDKENAPYPVEPNDQTLTRSTRYDSMMSEIMELVNKHGNTVSFNNQELTMNVGETKTLTDTNGVLGNYFEVESNDNLDLRIEGNNLVVTAKKGFEGTVSLKAKTNNNVPLIYDGANQKCLSRGDPTFINGNIKLKANVEFTSKKVMGSSNSGTYIPEEGAVFELYNVDTNELITTLTSDINGEMSVYLGFGNYKLHQIEGKEGYQFIDDYYFTIDDTTTKIEVYLQNEKIKSDLVFDKVDAETNVGLGGAVIEIYDTKTDELVYTGTTSDDGSIILKDFEYGNYYIIEKVAPEGYEINPDKIYFSIDENGEVVKINMKDKKIEVETEIIDVPNTNVSDDYLLDIILLALAGTGIALIVYAKKKQKK